MDETSIVKATAFDQIKYKTRRLTGITLSSPYISSTLIIAVFWIIVYCYTFITYIPHFTWWRILLNTALLLVLLSFLSIIPLLVYALFNYLRQNQVLVKTYAEFSHYNLLTNSLRSEINRASKRTYDPSNYRIAIPFAIFTLALGWVLFFCWPGTTNVAEFFITGETNLLLSPESFHPIVFGFLGTVFWYEGTLYHRYIRGDLTETTFINIAVRILIVLLLTLVISVIWPGYKQPWSGTENNEVHVYLLALSFVVGVFPMIGFQVIQRIASKTPGVSIVTKKEEFSLDRIHGLGLWDQGRLAEEGIDNVQNLAECDVFGLIVNTRLSVMALLHWVDQALLIMHVGNDIEKLKALGITTATAFEAAYVVQLPEPDKGDVVTQYNAINIKNQRQMYSYMGREGISKVPDPPESLIDALGGGDDTKGRVRSMMSTLCDDVNYQRLWQIRHGKSFILSSNLSKA